MSAAAAPGHEGYSMLNRLRNLAPPAGAKSLPHRAADRHRDRAGGRAGRRATMRRWRARAISATPSCIARCGLIAESVGALSFVLYEGAAELTAHPLLDLMARPNPRQDGASFLESGHLASAARRQRLYRGGRHRRRNAQAGARALRAAARPHEGGAGAGRLAAGLRIHRGRRAPCASSRAPRSRRSCSSRCSIRSTIITG